MENEEVTLILEDAEERMQKSLDFLKLCLLYTSPSPRDRG